MQPRESPDTIENSDTSDHRTPDGRRPIAFSVMVRMVVVVVMMVCFRSKGPLTTGIIGFIQSRRCRRVFSDMVMMMMMMMAIGSRQYCNSNEVRHQHTLRDGDDGAFCLVWPPLTH